MAQEFDEIVEVIVDQQTTALSEPSFSIPAIVSLFDETEIPGWSAGQRTKYYATDSEMSDDGFPVDHIARVAFNAEIGQSPSRVEKVLICREDSADVAISETMNACADEQPEFYDCHYKIQRSNIITFEGAFIADNGITLTIVTAGGVTYNIPTVDFDTDNATTYASIVEQILAAIPDSSVTADEPNLTIKVEILETSVASISAEIKGGVQTLVEMSADFVTDNSIAIDITYSDYLGTVTEVSTIDVPFDTDNSDTYDAIKTAIEAAIAGSVVTVDSVANEFDVTMAAFDVLTVQTVVTGGASQAIATNTKVSPAMSTDAAVALTTAEDLKFRQLGAWAEANERIHGYVTDVAAAKDDPYDAELSPQPDLGAYFRSVSYRRSYGYFDKNNAVSELDVAASGENLPYGPAADGRANTWSFKTPKGIAVKGYSSSERSNLESKLYNVFLSKRGTNFTLWNFTATLGEPIEAVIAIDWVVFLLQRNIFVQLLNKRAVPLNDNGMLTIVGKVIEATDEAETKGALVPGQTTITYPKYAELPEADRNAGVFSGIVVEARIQRMTQKVKVRFIITA